MQSFDSRVLSVYAPAGSSSARGHHMASRMHWQTHQCLCHSHMCLLHRCMQTVKTSHDVQNHAPTLEPDIRQVNMVQMQKCVTAPQSRPLTWIHRQCCLNPPSYNSLDPLYQTAVHTSPNNHHQIQCNSYASRLLWLQGHW